MISWQFVGKVGTQCRSYSVDELLLGCFRICETQKKIQMPSRKIFHRLPVESKAKQLAIAFFQPLVDDISGSLGLVSVYRMHLEILLE